jgi:hypothetical protein
MQKLIREARLDPVNRELSSLLLSLLLLLLLGMFFLSFGQPTLPRALLFSIDSICARSMLVVISYILTP